MKTVLVELDYRVPGVKRGTEDTIIDPETDILEDPSESDPPEFLTGEIVAVRFTDSPFTAQGKVTKLHEDEYGILVQLNVDWTALVPIINE